MATLILSIFFTSLYSHIILKEVSSHHFMHEYFSVLKIITIISSSHLNINTLLITKEKSPCWHFQLPYKHHFFSCFWSSFQNTDEIYILSLVDMFLNSLLICRFSLHLFVKKTSFFLSFFIVKILLNVLSCC